MVLSADLFRVCPRTEASFFLPLDGEVPSFQLFRENVKLLPRDCFFSFSCTDVLPVPEVESSLSLVCGLTMFFPSFSAQSCLMNSILIVSVRLRILCLWFSGMFRRSSIASKCLSISLGSIYGSLASWDGGEGDFDLRPPLVVRADKTLLRDLERPFRVES